MCRKREYRFYSIFYDKTCFLCFQEIHVPRCPWLFIVDVAVNLGTASDLSGEETIFMFSKEEITSFYSITTTLNIAIDQMTSMGN
jgi:hypothetical protein